MTRSARAALVGDIGGTNARFAIADLDSGELSGFAASPCDRFGSLPEAIAAYLDSGTVRPERAAMAVAGPVHGDRVKLTNRDWSFTVDEIRAVTGAAEVRLINDFEALALSLPGLGAGDLCQIGGHTAVPRAPMAVLGPGTGFGVAGLVPCGTAWVPVAGEGGHVSFAARNTEDLAILERMRKGSKGSTHLCLERLVSGPGLSALHEILSEFAGRPVVPRTAPEIVARALAGEDPIAKAVLGHFAEWLGRFAGDVALVFGARGGVYLGGGIAPRIVDVLREGRFRSAFDDKGPLGAYVSAIPVHVIVTPDAGLRGAAAALIGFETTNGTQDG